MLVEYPGYVADEQKVLETLGGAAGLARQLQVGGGCRSPGTRPCLLLAAHVVERLAGNLAGLVPTVLLQPTFTPTG